MLHKIFSDEKINDIQNMMICMGNKLNDEEKKIINESIKKYKEIVDEIGEMEIRTNKRRIWKIFKHMEERIYETDIYNDEYKGYEYIEVNKIRKNKDTQMDIIHIYI